MEMGARRRTTELKAAGEDMVAMENSGKCEREIIEVRRGCRGCGRPRRRECERRDGRG